MSEAMGFFTDTTICIGCKACEVACKNWNQLPAENGGVKKMSGNSYDNTERLDGIHLVIEERGDTVVIEANRKDASWDDRNNNVVETDFEIEVPTRTNLDIHVFSSDVKVTGVEGKATLKTFSGGLTLNGYAGPISVSSSRAVATRPRPRRASHRCR